MTVQDHSRQSVSYFDSSYYCINNHSNSNRGEVSMTAITRQQPATKASEAKVAVNQATLITTAVNKESVAMTAVSMESVSIVTVNVSAVTMTAVTRQQLLQQYLLLANNVLTTYIYPIELTCTCFVVDHLTSLCLFIVLLKVN